MSDRIKVIKLGMTNAYLLAAGDGFVLVDTGLPKTWERLESQLISAGCLPDRLKLVVITHGDFDHTGACTKLKERYGAKIAMHQADSSMVEKGVPLDREPVHPLFKMILALRRLAGMKVLEIETFEPDISLTDGQSLAGYGVDAKVLHLPGHTPGSIVLLIDDGGAIVGDIVTNIMKPGVTPSVENREQLRRSLQRLTEMDLETIYPGHGKPFPAAALKGISSKFRRHYQEQERRK